MEHTQFKIGCEFTTEGPDGILRWRCTDVGTRTIVAIRVDPVEVATTENGVRTTITLSQLEASRMGWFNGPPYAVAEYVFDEDDMEACEMAKPLNPFEHRR